MHGVRILLKYKQMKLKENKQAESKAAKFKQENIDRQLFKSNDLGSTRLYPTDQ